jgi:hypothetical protein
MRAAAWAAKQNVNADDNQNSRIRRRYLDSGDVRYAIGHVCGSANLEHAV